MHLCTAMQSQPLAPPHLCLPQVSIRTVPMPSSCTNLIIPRPLPLSSRPRRPARPLIWMYSPEVSQRKPPPSNFRALVNTTVLAGMLSPVEKVSVANRTCRALRCITTCIRCRHECAARLMHALCRGEVSADSITPSVPCCHDKDAQCKIENRIRQVAGAANHAIHSRLRWGQPALMRFSWNRISMTSLRMGRRPEWCTPTPRFSIGSSAPTCTDQYHFIHPLCQLLGITRTSPVQERG